MSYRRLIVVVFDLLATAAAVFMTYLLRLGAHNLCDRLEDTARTCAVLLLAAAFTFWVLRLDRSPWRLVSVSDLKKIMIASTILVGVLIVVQFLSSNALFVPRTMPIIFWFVEILFLASPRIFYRILRAVIVSSRPD